MKKVQRECFNTYDGSLKSVSNNISDDVKHNVSESSELQQAGAYFKVKFINNSDTYNNVIKTAGNFNFDNNDLKYPFFIIQPKRIIQEENV